MVLLQNCMGFVEDETGCCIETCVECDVGGTEEVSIKVEVAVDMEDEIPEAISFPPMKTEHEVRLWVCVTWWQLVLLGNLLPEKETVKLHLTISFFVLHCGCHIAFEIWISILKRRDF